MVYVKSTYKYSRRQDLENPHIETIWLEIQLKNTNLLLCCLYRNDFTATQSLFVREIQNSMALDYTPFMILMGDINYRFF